MAKSKSDFCLKLPTTQLFVIFVIFKGGGLALRRGQGSKAAAETHLIPACSKWAQSKLLTFRPRLHDTQGARGLGVDGATKMTAAVAGPARSAAAIAAEGNGPLKRQKVKCSLRNLI